MSMSLRLLWHDEGGVAYCEGGWLAPKAENCHLALYGSRGSLGLSAGSAVARGGAALCRKDGTLFRFLRTCFYFTYPWFSHTLRRGFRFYGRRGSPHLLAGVQSGGVGRYVNTGPLSSHGTPKCKNSAHCKFFGTLLVAKPDLMRDYL